MKEVRRPEKIEKDVLVSTMLPGVWDVTVAKPKLMISRMSVNFVCIECS